MAADFAAWLASLPRRPAGEIIVPATIDYAIVEAISKAEFVPILVDVRPGLYVLEAQYACPAMTEKTVGVYAPWTYGNQPELEHIEPGCKVHGIALYSPALPFIDDADATFWKLYDLLSPFAYRDTGVLTLPEKLDDTDPYWTCMPLLARTELERNTWYAALANHGFGRDVKKMGEFGTFLPEDERMATLPGPWGIAGQLPGAAAIARRGFTIPLDLDVGRALVRLLS